MVWRGLVPELRPYDHELCEFDQSDRDGDHQRGPQRGDEQPSQERLPLGPRGLVAPRGRLVRLPVAPQPPGVLRGRQVAAGERFSRRRFVLAGWR